jgi:molecular chaperone Hsp33
MLAESQLYSFLDRNNDFLIHFFEGQKLIQDLVLTHNLKEKGFSYFRDLILSTQPMISLLKPKEGFGIYLDSEEPYFRWKIETNWNGNMRALLIPEEFNLTPSKVNGTCRLVKLPPNNQKPYTSLIELKQSQFGDIINGILANSFQNRSVIKISDVSDQSIMLMKLPKTEIDKETIEETLSLKEYLLLKNNEIQGIFQEAFNKPEEIINKFTSNGYSLINQRKVQFHCPCTKDRMLFTIRNLYLNNKENFFKPNEITIDMKCDYCKKLFSFSKDEIIQLSS